jgi:hypothetical protein
VTPSKVTKKCPGEAACPKAECRAGGCVVEREARSQVAKSSRRTPKRAAQLGVTDDEYARLLAAQDGHCALCPNRPKSRRLHVDHDHATRQVRGLLCHRCNRALPTWVTAAWLVRAAMYVDPERGDLIARSNAVSYAATSRARAGAS